MVKQRWRGATAAGTIISQLRPRGQMDLAQISETSQPLHDTCGNQTALLLHPQHYEEEMAYS